FMAFLKGERDYRVLFIHGPGGIGKTWLLHEMMTITNEMELANCVLADELVDMYSTFNHSIEGIRERIISLLGEETFQNYRKSQGQLENAEQSGFPEEILQNMRQRLHADFLEDCKNLAEQKKIFLFFDAFERVQRVQVGSWLLAEFARELPNFRFVIASREKWGGNSYIHLLQLDGFSVSEAEKYFEILGREKNV
ncbi:MAG: AAA family ATPase, partial [Candidatus Brocadiales bacterium]|nr:AAA family ATPase [Candidatus Brocadiales bacterium]